MLNKFSIRSSVVFMMIKWRTYQFACRDFLLVKQLGVQSYLDHLIAIIRGCTEFPSGVAPSLVLASAGGCLAVPSLVSGVFAASSIYPCRSFFFVFFYLSWVLFVGISSRAWSLWVFAGVFLALGCSEVFMKLLTLSALYSLLSRVLLSNFFANI